MSDLQIHFETFKALTSMREFCTGEDCRGWHLSEVDTWHECPCNASKGYPNPEDDSTGYVVTAWINGSEMAVEFFYRKDTAQRVARRYAKNHRGVRLRRIPAEGDVYEKVMMQIETVRDWDSDGGN